MPSQSGPGGDAQSSGGSRTRLSAARHARDGRLTRGWVLFAAAMGVAILLYRPQTPAPFEVIDFSETLPYLTSDGSTWSRTLDLIRYYQAHGRFAPLLSAGLVAKWDLFGWWTPGWQWTRFVVLAGVLALAWSLLRTLRASPLGATAGTSVFLLSHTAAPGWLRPALNEPFGTLTLLAASLLACHHQATRRPALLAGAVAALLGVSVLCKEMLVGMAFLPIVIALCRNRDGLLEVPSATARNGLLIGMCAVVLLAALAPTAWTALHANPDGYVRDFGSGMSISNALFALLSTLFPFTSTTQAVGVLTAVTVVAWLLLLVLGWRVGRASSAERRHARILLSLGLSLVVMRVLIYLPWPLQHPYYSIPFLLGISILLAFGITFLERESKALRAGAVAALVLIGATSAAGVSGEVTRHYATRTVLDALLADLARLPAELLGREIVVAVPALKEQRWTGLGPTLRRYASATNRPLPAMEDRLCREVPSASSREVVVALRWQCQVPGIPARSVHAIATRFDLSRLRLVADTLFADVFLTERPRDNGS